MTTSPLVERVENLERQLRFLRLSLVFLAVLCVTVLATRLRATTDRIDARIVSAQQFDILNVEGKVVGRINNDPGDPTGFSGGLVLMYPNHKAALSLGTGGKYGPGVSLFDMDGRARAMMGFAPDGPAIDLFDEAHRPIISMEIRSKGPRFKVFDKSLKKYVWTAP
jgi:hypothetical protein